LQKLTTGKLHDASLKRNLRWRLGNSSGINDIGVKRTTHFIRLLFACSGKTHIWPGVAGKPDAND
jgi:hypothetical protein